MTEPLVQLVKTDPKARKIKIAEAAQLVYLVVVALFCKYFVSKSKIPFGII